MGEKEKPPVMGAIKGEEARCAGMESGGEDVLSCDYQRASSNT
jgi:hypothetical protein